jgi:hypothetical protein
MLTTAHSAVLGTSSEAMPPVTDRRVRRHWRRKVSEPDISRNEIIGRLVQHLAGRQEP